MRAPQQTSCPGCGAPPEARGCSYCGRGRTEAQPGDPEYDAMFAQARALYQVRAHQDAAHRAAIDAWRRQAQAWREQYGLMRSSVWSEWWPPIDPAHP